MPNRGHVQKTRLVVNSSHDKTTVEQLLSLSVQQCVKNFRLGMAMVARKDHRSYAPRKCDSNHMSHHKVHSDTVKKYSNSTQGLSARCNTRLDLNYS